MFCDQCGTENKNDATICIYCSASLTDMNEGVAGTSRRNGTRRDTELRGGSGTWGGTELRGGSGTWGETELRRGNGTWGETVIGIGDDPNGASGYDYPQWSPPPGSQAQTPDPWSQPLEPWSPPPVPGQPQYEATDQGIINKFIHDKKALVIVSSISALIVIAVIVMAVVLGSAGSKEYNDKISIGDDYLASGAYEDAVDAYTAAIELEPERPEAYIKKAEAQEDCGKKDDAIKTLNDGYANTGGDKDIGNRIRTLSGEEPAEMPEKSEGLAVYDELLEHIRGKVELYDPYWSTYDEVGPDDKCQGYDLNDILDYEESEEGEYGDSLYYSYFDVDGNGTEELILAQRHFYDGNSDTSIFGMYATDGETCYEFLDYGIMPGGLTDMLICEDGDIIIEGYRNGNWEVNFCYISDEGIGLITYDTYVEEIYDDEDQSYYNGSEYISWEELDDLVYNKGIYQDPSYMDSRSNSYDKLEWHKLMK